MLNQPIASQAWGRHLFDFFFIATLLQLDKKQPWGQSCSLQLAALSLRYGSGLAHG